MSRYTKRATKHHDAICWYGERSIRISHSSRENERWGIFSFYCLMMFIYKSSWFIATWTDIGISLSITHFIINSQVKSATSKTLSKLIIFNQHPAFVAISQEEARTAKQVAFNLLPVVEIMLFYLISIHMMYRSMREICLNFFFQDEVFILAINVSPNLYRPVIEKKVTILIWKKY